MLGLQNLSHSTDYELQIHAGSSELDRVKFTTAPYARDVGRVKFVFGSCSDMSQHTDDVPIFTAMRKK